MKVDGQSLQVCPPAPFWGLGGLLGWLLAIALSERLFRASNRDHTCIVILKRESRQP